MKILSSYQILRQLAAYLKANGIPYKHEYNLYVPSMHMSLSVDEQLGYVCANISDYNRICGRIEISYVSPAETFRKIEQYRQLYSHRLRYTSFRLIKEEVCYA